MTWKYSGGNDSHNKLGNKTLGIKLTRNGHDLYKIKTLPNDI